MITIQSRQRSAVKGQTFGARKNSCSCDPCDCNPCGCNSSLVREGSGRQAARAWTYDGPMALRGNVFMG